MECARILLAVHGTSPDKAAFAMAGFGGHPDVLQAVMRKWPDHPLGEAFSWAILASRAEIARLLRGAAFAWTPVLEYMVSKMAPTDLMSMAVCAQASRSGDGGSTPNPSFGGLRWLMVNCSAPQRAVSSLLKYTGELWLSLVPRGDAEFLDLLFTAEPCLRDPAGRYMRAGWHVHLLAVWLGGYEHCPEDMLTYADPRVWHFVIHHGAACHWRQHPDGTKHLYSLQALENEVDIVSAIQSLRLAEFPFARHHVCGADHDTCPCDRLRR